MVEEIKILIEKIKHDMAEGGKRARGCVFTCDNGFMGVIWEEPEDEYLARMAELDKGI